MARSFLSSYNKVDVEIKFSEFIVISLIFSVPLKVYTPVHEMMCVQMQGLSVSTFPVTLLSLFVD